MTAGRWVLVTALVSGPAALLVWWAAGFVPQTVEAWYSRGLYPLVAAPWSRLTGLVPFALTPYVLTALVVTGAALFAVLPWTRALAGLGAGVSVLLAWFVLGWALGFQRPSWAELHGWTSRGGTVTELTGLTGRLAAEAASRRLAWTAAGSPRFTLDQTAPLVTRAYARAGASDPLLAGAWGGPKAFPAPDLLSWLGIGGIFIPHLAEPLVNTGPANWQLPFTAAHEAAHLRGFCREDEANFLAFWVLKDDPDPRCSYSAFSYALLYAGSALAEAGPGGAEAWGRIAAGLDPGIRADWDEMRAYWRRFEGPVRDAAQAVNDTYLKSQGQTDGVRSYGRMVDLLLASGAGSETQP